MLEFFISKIYYVLFILSILNIMANIYKFLRSWALSENNEVSRYKITKKDVVYLGLSISYFITSCIIGITL